MLGESYWINVIYINIDVNICFLQAICKYTNLVEGCGGNVHTD